MSELNINDLPREVLMQVFRFLNLNFASLKNATLACKLWNNLIESECRWTLKLSYDNIGTIRCAGSYSAELQKINFIRTTKRKFGTIQILIGRGYRGLGTIKSIYETLERHGANVVKLRFDVNYIESLRSLAEHLNFTPNVKDVVVYNVKLNSEVDVPLDQDLPDLNKLKNLNMTYCDDRIIQCFRKAKLTTISVFTGHPVHDSLIDFLSSQEELTSLAINRSCSILSGMGKPNVPIQFRLAGLRIFQSFVRTSPHELVDPVNFLQSQKETLVELEIGDRIPNNIYQSLLAMPKLTTLTVWIDRMPLELDFYNQLEVNRSFRTLKLRADEWGWATRFFSIFFRTLPNLLSLILPHLESPCDNQNNEMLQMAQNFGKLESLYVDAFNGRSMQYVKFPNLKTLRIKRLSVKIDWDEFIKDHARLTELTIETMNQESRLTSDDIDRMATSVDLKNIRLGDGFVADDRFFEIIRTKCKNLKVLDLHKSCMPYERAIEPKIAVLRLCDAIETPLYQMY